MPDSLVTIERRVPVKRLKSVDLPTLGRPTMTRDGRRSAMSSWAGPTVGAAACCAIFQCSAFRVALVGKWVVISGQGSVKRKTGINAEVAESAEFTETEPEEASKRLQRGSREESWLVMLPSCRRAWFLT